ncbi:MAG: sulfatase [Muribaculaceae bacterium]|nr:sulfatase [Muribaculaceae bacterium]
MAALGSMAGNPSKPNIIFFLVDDMGWADSSVIYGDQTYPLNLRHHTPNMQRLAAKGTIFANAYACPVSSPTRTSLMSGMNAAHSKITDFTTAVPGVPSDASHKPDALKNDVLVHPEWNWNGISPESGIPHTVQVTPMTRLLQDDGYYTIHVGKGHWAAAGTPAASPYNLGFCVNVAGQVAGKPTSYYGKENYGNTKEMWSTFSTMNMTEYYGSDIHLTEALTREALKTLDYPVKNNLPFYLYLAHHGVHTPITPDPRFVQKYLDAGLDEGQAKYASLVEGVDKSLGDVLDYLEANDIADNTVIIFMSDNGGNSENKTKGGVLHTQNAPLREGKASCYEGGVKVPLMVYWPGKTHGSRTEIPVIAEDLYPTILEIAGISGYNTIQQIDGKSIAGLISGNEAPGISYDRELVFHFPHQWKPYPLEDIDYMTSMRKGDWKIVYRHRTGKLELYNLKDDLSERNDLSKKNKKKLREMASALSNRLRGWEAPMPTFRSDGRQIPYPDEL